MKTTRAKFFLSKIEITQGSRPKVDIVMSPVSGGGDPNHENTKFWAASPGGEFRLNVVNLAAVEHMVIGREYYLDITEAPAS